MGTGAQAPFNCRRRFTMCGTRARINSTRRHWIRSARRVWLMTKRMPSWSVGIVRPLVIVVRNEVNAFMDRRYADNSTLETGLGGVSNARTVSQ